MSQAANTIRLTLYRYAALIAAVILSAFTPGSGHAQSLRFVPPIYTVSSVSNVLNSPNALATDVAGNVYIADTGHSLIWKVDTTQTATIFAGKGNGTYSGDNGPAINAAFNSPQAIAIDVAGNIFIADTNNFAIRRIDATTGIVTTIAGGNGSGYTGDNGPATSAQFKGPTGVAVDLAGDIYVSDSTSAVVRKISTSGIITTFAGGGTPASGNGDGGPATSAKLTGPYGLAVDASGNVYIADQAASLVRMVASNGTISTFAGTTKGNSGQGGPAISAQLNAPRSVAVDASGNVYIADGGANIVSVVDATGTINVLTGLNVFGTVGDGLPASEVTLSTPYGLAVDLSGNVFISSSSTDTLYRVVQHPERFPMTSIGASSPAQRLILENIGTSSITTSSVALSGDFQISSTLGSNPSPCKLATNKTISPGFGNYCTLDVVFTPTASGIRSFPLTVTSNDTPSSLVLTLSSTGLGATVSTSGGLIYTVAGLFPSKLPIRGDNIAALTASLNGINGLVVDSAGDIIFTEYGFCQVRKVNGTTGIISTIAGINPLTCDPGNVAIGPNGEGGPATLATLYLPGALALGPNNTLYLSDSGHGQIKTIDNQGIIHTIAGTGTCGYAPDGSVALTSALCGAGGMVVDATGNLIFTDGQNQLVRKISTAGILTTVAGSYNNGVGGFSGDNGPAVNARLNGPQGIGLDAAGNIYFVDRFNYVVRKVSTTGVITTVAGSPGLSSYTGDGGLARNATINFSSGLTLDAAGNIYIADAQNNVVRRVDATSGIITTVAGNHFATVLNNNSGIPATAVTLNYPENVAIDAYGSLVIADRNWLIREVDPNGALDFGNQAINTTSTVKTVTVSNIGNTPLHFNSTTPYATSGDFAFVSGGTCDFTQPLAAGASCNVRVSFTPAAAYERYGTLAFYNDGVASPQMAQLRGNGTLPIASQAVLSPSTLNFSNQVINTTSSSQTITVSNPGTATLNISGISVVGADPTAFTQTSTCGATLAVNTHCSITVTFTPTSVRSFAATVAVADDAVGSPQTAALTGTGINQAVAQAILNPTSLAFAAQTVGSTSATQSITLSNPGNAALQVSKIALVGANASAFSESDDCGQSVSADSACTISIAFTPPSAGTFTASVQVLDSAANSPQSATLTGTGTAALVPQAVLTPASLAFASQTVATTSASQKLTLTNPGNAPLSISGISLAGANPAAFSQTNTCTATLAPGASCSISVTFSPNAGAAFSATVSVADNAAGSPHTATVTGTGTTVPDFGVSPTPASVSVSAGSAAQYVILTSSLAASNPFNGPVTLTATGMPAGATASFSPSIVTPGAAAAPSTLTIQTAAPALAQNTGASTHIRLSSLSGLLSIPLTLLGLGFLGVRGRHRLPRLLAVIAMLAISGIGAIGLTGCGGGFALPATGNTYTITVTGTSGSIQHSATVTLNLK
jgi:trimeric autotransporter adhesin